ncbi:MAG: aminotransferase class I/II-fold pyridoxal phosphate-dependent enzyme, partial [Chloroflexota bacterium]
MTTDLDARAPLADRVLAERVRVVPPSGIRRFFDIAATMDDVISLGVGEPDFDTPRHIVEAAGDALEGGYTHYGPSMGLPELRQAIARYLAEGRGVEVPWQRIVVTPGGKPPMFYTITAL